MHDNPNKKIKKWPKYATHYRKETARGYDWVEIATLLTEKIKKVSPTISSVIKVKGTHAWINTDKGIFRKELKYIPANVL